MSMYLSQTKPLSHVVLWVIFLIPSCVLSFDERYRICSTPFQCGNQTNLSYPFWTKGREACGPLGFEVDCHGDFPEISISSSIKLQIRGVDYSSSIIRFARTDYLNDLCPSNPENVTMFDEIFHGYAPGTEVVTLYYECNGLPSWFSPAGYIGELGCSDANGYYVSKNFTSPVLTPFSSFLNALIQSCKRSFSVPASGSVLIALDSNLTPENLQNTFREGFGLTLNKDCEECVASRGTCGYYQSLGGFVCYCTDKPHQHTCSSDNKGVSLTPKTLIGAVSAGSVFVLVILLFIFWKTKKSNSHMRKNLKVKELIPLKQYSYSEVKRITDSFTHVIGRGGFGTVYGGNLRNGQKVVVKLLKHSEGDSEEFINEVASMSKTSHVNIVSLLGFCYERSKREIIYEFLENGSLDNFISGTASVRTEWTTLYGIALGVARGVEYLHYGCKTRIVHFDIKPQNVLLDSNLCPKVSDFGLAKLCEKKESVVSLLDARGTIGYIAPEVFSRMYGDVSHKSDVYSYGMLVLEMIGARNKRHDNSATSTSSMYFPDWIYKDLERGQCTRFLEDEVAEEEEEEMVKKMIMVASWCIQSCPSHRPSMKRVVEMMEGNLDDIEVPPKPTLHLPATYLPESQWASEESLNSSEFIIHEL